MPPTGPTWESYRRLENTVAKLEDDLGDKHMENVTRLTKIEAILEDAVNRLFGNGQPGLLSKQDERITKLEGAYIKIASIAGVLIILIEVLHQIPIKELLGIGGK